MRLIQSILDISEVNNSVSGVLGSGILVEQERFVSILRVHGKGNCLFSLSCLEG